MSERCANTEAINKYYEDQAFAERQLENFESDIEKDMNLIEEAIIRIRDIERGYESFDFEEEYKERIKDML